MNGQAASRTILVVDDHAGFRATARRLLEGDGWNVVGEATDAASAIESVARLGPDVVLLDIGLPGRDGFHVAERIAAARSGDRGPAVVLVSSRERSEYGARIAMSPVHGFIAKADLDGPRLRRLVADSLPGPTR